MVTRSPGETGMDPFLVEKAYAKINLGLKILGRREDGFHELVSICQTVDLSDRLEFFASSSDGMSCSSQELTGKDNLVMRALRLCRGRMSGDNRPVHVHLEKRIPVGAGLGGGSADAAAVLRGMAAITGVQVSIETLATWGAELGSDVPFLVRGGTALMRGRGEIVEPVSCERSFEYVIAYPGVKIDTAWAYGQLRSCKLTPDSGYARFIGSLGGGRVDANRLVALIDNDFQPIAERAKPIVAETREQLLAAGAATASLTGSGSAVYGIFDDRIAASSAHLQLTAKGIRSFHCRTRD